MLRSRQCSLGGWGVVQTIYLSAPMTLASCISGHTHYTSSKKCVCVSVCTHMCLLACVHKRATMCGPLTSAVQHKSITLQHKICSMALFFLNG